MNLPDELVAEVKKNLVGPQKPDEVLPVPPADYYKSGILFPKNAEPDSLDTDDLEMGGSDGEVVKDAGGPIRPQTKQSSIGLHVDIRDGVDSVNLELNYAKYKSTEKCWERTPLAPEWRNHTISLGERRGLIKICDDDGREEAELRWTLDEGGDGTGRYRVLSCYLSNAAIWIEYKRGNDFRSVRVENSLGTIFQPSIRIHSERPIFRNYRLHMHHVLRTAEDQSLDLLFADTVSFGRGSNCAVVWEREREPRWVGTEFVPRYVAPDIGKESDGSDGRPGSIDMHRLSYAEGDDDERYRRQIAGAVRPLVDSYRKWIDTEEQKIPDLARNKEFRAEVAKSHIGKCREAHGRMEEGLEFLLDENNKKARLAFALSNRAMLYQRLHYDYSLKVAKGKKPARPVPDAPGKAFWYPFQIAFFIMNVRGIADKSSAERDMVDLLWFPTGGGKTEAYLAVAAFAMIYRRMKAGDGNDGLGVSVIMRYTLRLLTLQQFERASALMCALEFVRRNNPEYRLGRDPFLIGLWVGQNLTPNTSWQSKEALHERSESDPEGSPVQHTHCPWCGTRVDERCYAVDAKSGWTIAHCSNTGCFFYSRDATETKHALPVLTVDDDIYRRCPAMVIATVDKFARMPYNEKTASLFGRVSRYCERHGFLAAGDKCSARSRHRGADIYHIHELDGPDLIIQDELHLITGPLGSMVGLYETAVDYLSRRGSGNGAIRPKIIASTATIRGADDQVRKIFNRDTPSKFPPPGIQRTDSFFWWESGRNGRQYVGTSFSHLSAKYSLAWIYASLLQKAKAASDTLGQRETDPYWTLVCYFNSIRELGGAIRLVEDDVVSNIRFIAGVLRGGQEERHPGKPGEGLKELTGRIKQADMRDIREKLGRTMGEPGCISTLLATNMISVGLDIERLGMMVVNGQTKSASEYIQATGRIGRRHGVPGLVFTLYNPYKPRDLSHYEDFSGYHAMLHRYVEPSTLTPFSVGSVERGLHAVLVSMVRLSTPHLSCNESADLFRMDHAAEAISFILARYERVQQVGRDDESYQYVKKYLNAFVDNWRRRVRQAHEDDPRARGYYSKPPGSSNRPADARMLDSFNEPPGDTNDFPKSTPDSLRNVERMVDLRYH